MKKIAFYLPQFHAIPENDEWWGKGFTEWTNVKASKPQFKGHCQPEIPLNNNYYNLLNSETQKWQSELAMKYGIDGFCYYHYWFEGKLLLEKPMENMLNNKSIRIPFCICWANETWARTWDGQENHVLIKQNYNEDIDAWKKHFDYLLPFFRDSRYIRRGNSPMLLIYKPQLIKNCTEIIKFWRKLAVKEGFDDLYIGYQHPSAFDSGLPDFDFGVEFEPFYTVAELQKSTESIKGKVSFSLKNPVMISNWLKHKFLRKPIIYDYDIIWEQMLKRRPKYNNVMPGAFPSWDNTPRKGNMSFVFYKATPEKFKEYLAKQLGHAENEYQADYIFINAWNEWGEGAHLEPDEEHEYGYLEAVKSALAETNELLW